MSVCRIPSSPARSLTSPVREVIRPPDAAAGCPNRAAVSRIFRSTSVRSPMMVAAPKPIPAAAMPFCKFAAPSAPPSEMPCPTSVRRADPAVTAAVEIAETIPRPAEVAAALTPAASMSTSTWTVRPDAAPTAASISGEICSASVSTSTWTVRPDAAPTAASTSVDTCAASTSTSTLTVVSAASAAAPTSVPICSASTSTSTLTVVSAASAAAPTSVASCAASTSAPT